MESEHGLGEKLNARLQALFTQDPLIDEIGLILGVEPHELSVENAFVLEDHKLGVAFSAALPLFRAARAELGRLRKSLYGIDVSTLDLDNEIAQRLQWCTHTIVLICADCYTALNVRKRLVSLGKLGEMEELRFCDLICTLHPKSIDTWAYRRWLAARCCKSLKAETLHTFFDAQIQVCSRLAEQKPRNYHAWSFRHWITSHFQTEDMLMKELKTMERWCKTHISDHSGWNHRQHTIKVVVQHYKTHEPTSAMGEEKVKRLIISEYKLLSEIMAPYPTHESLWCHRRFVIQLYLQEVVRFEKSTTENDEHKQEYFELTELIREFEATVQGALTSKQNNEEHGPSKENLMASWEEIRNIFTADRKSRELKLGAILKEVKVAWTCNNRFARRYALWCLERLQSAVGVKDDGDCLGLSSLVNSIRKRLSKDDPVLENLWSNTTR